MANTKITELVIATSLDSNTQNTLLVIVDKSSGTPVTKQVELQKIDSVLDITVDKANSAAVYANGAFVQSNSAYGSQNTTGIYANAAFLKANSAYDSQNTTGVYANAAFLKANTPSEVSNSASLYANGAFVQSNAAFNHANAAFIVANTPSSLSNTTSNVATASFIHANAAFNYANSNLYPAETKINVSTSGSTAYLFDHYVGNNPTIYVTPGRTIAFDLNYISGHPFLIRMSISGTNVSSGLIHVSSSGVTSYNDEAQGKNNGVLYWKVPENLDNQTYAYQCAIHAGMAGDIQIEPHINDIFNEANVALQKANLSFNHANSAYDTANSALSIAQQAYEAAVLAEATQDAIQLDSPPTDRVVYGSYEIPNGRTGTSTGTVIIDDNATVTISQDSKWEII